MFTVVIPAYNEEKNIAATVKSAFRAFMEAGVPLREIIVSDDDSTDDTAETARKAGARVVRSGKRNIGATRNVGASAAKSEWLLFVDADTLIEAKTVEGMWKLVQQGVIGGGAKLTWSESTDFWVTCFGHLWNLSTLITRCPAGSFYFVRKDAFDRVGGFDEKYFAIEELSFSLQLKRHGRLRIVRHPVKTSPRKFRDFTKREFATMVLRSVFMPHITLRDKKYLAFWYERRG